MNPNPHQYPQYVEGLSYPDEVKHAVRYGYQYRVESEQQSQKEGSHFNRRIGDTPEIILWLASLVFDGVAWDVLKLIAETIIQGFKDRKKQMPQEAVKLLTNDTDIRTFYEYIVEYKEHRMTVSDKEIKFIVEEIVADYSGKEAAKIMSKEGRFPTDEENRRILREAYKAAEAVLSDRIKENLDTDLQE